MNYSQRKDSILSMLRVAEELSIRQLTDMTGASDATIRRDPARMEQEGCVRRSWAESAVRTRRRTPAAAACSARPSAPIDEAHRQSRRFLSEGRGSRTLHRLRHHHPVYDPLYSKQANSRHYQRNSPIGGPPGEGDPDFAAVRLLQGILPVPGGKGNREHAPQLPFRPGLPGGQTGLDTSSWIFSAEGRRRTPSKPSPSTNPGGHT